MSSRTTVTAQSATASKRQAKVIPLRARVPAGKAEVPIPSIDKSDDNELRRLRDALDHAAHAGLARITGGLSPAALAEAYADWAVHLAILLTPENLGEMMLVWSVRPNWRFDASGSRSRSLPNNDASRRSEL